MEEANALAELEAWLLEQPNTRSVTSLRYAVVLRGFSAVLNERDGFAGKTSVDHGDTLADAILAALKEARK